QMTPFLQDLRFALRLLLRDRTFYLAALVTLALAIGVNSAIFTVTNSVLLQPLPYPAPDRLVRMYNCYPNVGVPKGSNGVPDYFDRRKATDVFESLTLYDGRGFDVGEAGSPLRMDAVAATPSYFQVFGIQPIVGRPFSEEEGERGSDKVVLLSEGLWREMFASRQSVLGEDLRLSGVPHQIIGVVPEGFGGEDTRLYVPLTFTDEQKSDDARHSNSWEMAARLEPGVTVAQAQARIDAINKQNEALVAKYVHLLKQAGYYTRVAGLHEEMVEDIRGTLLILQFAAGLVLLIGCVNVANLLLVRSQGRLKELSIRVALGAGRWRVSRLLLTESLLLGLAGGVLGFGVAIGGVRLFTYLGLERLPRGAEVAVDAPVLWFTLAAALITSLIFGAIPLVHVLRSSLAGILRQTSRTTAGDRGASTTRAVLVVAQVSLAFILLIGAGLLMTSFRKVLSVDPGFEPEGVVTAGINLPGTRYEGSGAISRFIDQSLERIRSLPGVRGATATSYLPFGNSSNASAVRIEQEAEVPDELPPVPAWNIIEPDYFRVMGIPLLQGRGIEPTDT
ncbi:MAG: FtsX-like permease family protein, partial [bacterium]|nr:FtsX-like permease family protein [bacterium]